MENQDSGITEELINFILDNVCLILNIVEPKAPVEPVLPENPTEEEQQQYEKEMEQYNSEIAEYEPKKAEYDYLIQLLTLYIKIICNNILIRTNRRIFPEKLKYTVIDLVKDKFDSNNTNSEDIQSIQSMSEAGRSVNFGVSSVISNKLNLIAQKQLDENEILINRFRLLYKT